MANINFNDGFETFTINGDSNRVIKINPKDGNILIRFDEAMRDLKTNLNDSQVSKLRQTEVLQNRQKYPWRKVLPDLGSLTSLSTTRWIIYLMPM